MALLSEVKEHHPPASKPLDFPSERPVGAHITDKEMLETPLFSENDIFGNTIARYFPRDGKIYGLARGAFQNLRRLADQVVKAPWIKDAVGRSFIEDSIFLWCRENFGSADPSPLTDFLLKRATDMVEPSIIWVPIAFLEVEHEFEFGPVKLAPISAKMLDTRERMLIEGSPNHADQIRALFAKKRQRYQGLAAVVVDIEAVKDYAFNRAVELAEAVVGLLRLYSAAACVPWLTCPCAVIGTEYVPNTTAISYKDGSFMMRESALKPLPYPWRISAKEWADMRGNNLETLGTLLDESRLTDFQSRLRTSLLAYSKGLTFRDLGDRLVYSLSALEGLFLRDASEPIQQNLGERLAFLLHRDAGARQETVQNVREIYSMRSQYIHHRISVSQEGALETFFPTAARALLAATANMNQFATARDFIDAIDQVKFGG
jgi:hypothetical protein